MYEINCLLPGHEMQHFGVMERAFNDEEIDRIRFFEKILDFQDGEVVGFARGDLDKESQKAIRSCEVSYLPVDENTTWLWDKIGRLTSQANYDLFMYNISRLECLQYTIYNSTENGHYDFHRDTSLFGYRKNDRKISGILMLSDPSEYEGGDLEIDIGGDMKFTILNSLKKGDVVFFDSNFSHRVTEVTSGSRQVIVFWAHGNLKI